MAATWPWPSWPQVRERAARAVRHRVHRLPAGGRREILAGTRARARRNGYRVPRAGSPAGASGGHQGAATRTECEPTRTARAIRARSPDGRAAVAPEHRADPPRGRGGRLRVLRDGVHRGGVARRAVAVGRRTAGGRGGANPARRGLGTGVRALARHRAPGREAGQHPAGARHRARPDDGLRDCRRPADPEHRRRRLRAGNGAFPEPRAGGRRPGGRPQRHLLARHHGILHAHGTPAIRRAERDGGARGACLPPRPADRRGNARRTASARVRGRALPGEAPRTSMGERRAFRRSGGRGVRDAEGAARTDARVVVAGGPSSRRAVRGGILRRRRRCRTLGRRTGTAEPDGGCAGGYARGAADRERPAPPHRRRIRPRRSPRGRRHARCAQARGTRVRVQRDVRTVPPTAGDHLGNDDRRRCADGLHDAVREPLAQDDVSRVDLRRGRDRDGHGNRRARAVRSNGPARLDRVAAVEFLEESLGRTPVPTGRHRPEEAGRRVGTAAAHRGGARPGARLAVRVAAQGDPARAQGRSGHREAARGRRTETPHVA